MIARPTSWWCSPIWSRFCTIASGRTCQIPEVGLDHLTVWCTELCDLRRTFFWEKQVVHFFLPAFGQPCAQSKWLPCRPKFLNIFLGPLVCASIASSLCWRRLRLWRCHGPSNQTDTWTKRWRRWVVARAYQSICAHEYIGTWRPPVKKTLCVCLTTRAFVVNMVLRFLSAFRACESLRIANLGKKKIYQSAKTVWKQYWFSTIGCFETWLANRFFIETLRNKIQPYLDSFHLKDRNWSDGEPMKFGWKIFPTFSAFRFLEEILKMMVELQCEPDRFKGRIIFISMYDDIVWRHCMGSRKEETQKHVRWILLQLRIMLADSFLVVGHFWDWDQRRNRTELALMNQREMGQYCRKIDAQICRKRSPSISCHQRFGKRRIKQQRNRKEVCSLQRKWRNRWIGSTPDHSCKISAVSTEQ